MNRPFLFEKEIRLFGLKRSGNNALIMYISGHFNSKTNFILLPYTDFNFSPRSYRSNPFLFANRLEELEKGDPYCDKYLMVTVENYDLAYIREKDDDKKYVFNKDRKWYIRKYDKVNFSKAAYSILLLRSPHNNLASIIAKGWYPRLAPDFARLWVMYAKEFVGETDYLHGRIPCVFDKWFAYKDYREEFCNNLGLELNDVNLNRMRHGRRSSFDGKDYKGKAQKMKVLDRWKHYWRDEDFLKVLRNDDLIDLTEQIFGYDLRKVLPL